ncbi:MAG TPA: hypothetical protein VNX46_11360 [Candidatus Acidoferrum sp.]|nr:hypothetical protein [Candidatus Acidoferrum sp.]
MKSVTLQVPMGQTIEIRRGEKPGQIDIRHSKVHPTSFGSYYDVAERAQHPPIASFLGKFGIDWRGMATEDEGAYATINGRLCLLDTTEVAMIREAIKKLE